LVVLVAHQEGKNQNTKKGKKQYPPSYLLSFLADKPTNQDPDQSQLSQDAHPGGQ
jgi:hypothetical protein